MSATRWFALSAAGWGLGVIVWFPLALLAKWWMDRR